jgi:hypothetical protein
MWAPARGVCLSVWVCLGHLLVSLGVALVPVVAALRPGAPMLRGAGNPSCFLGEEKACTSSG